MFKFYSIYKSNWLKNEITKIFVYIYFDIIFYIDYLFKYHLDIILVSC